MDNNSKCSLKDLCKQAKKRLGSGYWQKFDQELAEKRRMAEKRGDNPTKVSQYFVEMKMKEINGTSNPADEFYEKVKKMLLEYGEVSDAIGRLIDYEVYDKLPYEQKQRYTLELSNKYIEALERFRKEKEFGFLE